MKKGLFLIITFLFVIILTLSGSSNFLSSLAIWDTCKDGTLNNKCSQEKPFFCSQGSLIKECNTCGCAAGFNCNTFTNECELSDYCEQSNGICQAECSPGSIELISLTESCNAGENINKLIQLEGSSLTLDLKLTNLKALVIVCNDSACPINRYPFGLRLSYRLAIICFFALSSKYIRTFLQNITSNPLIVLILTWS